jgi:Holliday junction resolvase RusA-like endonuclease
MPEGKVGEAGQEAQRKERIPPTPKGSMTDRLISTRDLVLSLTIEGEPCPKGRPRWGQGRTYTPAATRYAEAFIAWEAAKKLKRPLDIQKGRFILHCVFNCARRPGPDIDNLVKLVMDALSPKRARGRPLGPGLLWRNDRQVTRIEAERVDGSSDPRTFIKVWGPSCPG